MTIRRANQEPHSRRQRERTEQKHVKNVREKLKIQIVAFRSFVVSFPASLLGPDDAQLKQTKRISERSRSRTSPLFLITATMRRREEPPFASLLF